MQGDPRGRILAAVRAAGKPVTYTGLFKLVQGPAEDFRAALEAAAVAGEVFRWPDYRRSQYFWHATPEEKAREAVLAAAGDFVLSKADLAKAAARKLSGLSANRWEAAVSALMAEKKLKPVPAFEGKAKLLARSGDRTAYFRAARTFIEKKIRDAGFDPTEFFTQDSSRHDKLSETHADAAALVLDAVRFLEPVRGVPVSTLRLRNHLPSLSKQEFDMAALELRKKQEVFLSQHVDPYNISREDKDLLIDGRDGTYYVGIAIR